MYTIYFSVKKHDLVINNAIIKLMEILFGKFY
jgi:hypothetical protein